MKRWQAHFLGRQDLPNGLTPVELRHFFTFSEEETAAIMSRRGDRLRLGAALQVGFLKLSGRALESVESVSLPLLNHLRDTLGIHAPQLASLKTLYQRRATMFAYQQWARRLLGFQEFTERRQRVLIAYLREQAQHRETSEELVVDARVWLYERKVLIPGPRRLLNLARDALLGVADAHANAVREEIPNDVLERWQRSLVRRRAGQSHLEWLQERPRRLSQMGMRIITEKIRFLRQLGVHKYSLRAILIDRQLGYARSARRRRPVRLLELPDDKRVVTIACFMRISLLELTDSALGQFEMRAARLVARAEEKAVEAERRAATDAQACLEKIRILIEDDVLTDAEVRDRVRLELPEDTGIASHAEQTRKALREEEGRRVRSLLKDVLMVPLQYEPRARIGKAARRLKRLYKVGKSSLPKDVKSEFAAVWDQHINDTDGRRALRAYEAALLEDLRRNLRAGNVWSNESLTYREREAELIPKPDWAKRKRAFVRNLGMSASPEPLLEQFKSAIQVGLESVANAVEDGMLQIRGDEIRLPALTAEESADETPQTELFKELGSTDLPSILVEVDSQVRFTWTLLGRPPAQKRELLATYAAVLAHGTDLSASAVERVVPGVFSETVAAMMKSLEGGTRLRRANDAVVASLRAHPIAETWGDGTTASSDAMSLEASRHLWKARVDPRRRHYAIGMYTHVLDQWGIIYDQPIVLNQRQVGAAIEGVIRNRTTPNLQSLAVDTHGYTDFGMGISKLLGFDLCPRLRNLSHRHLYVPRGIKIPKSIRAICRTNVSIESIMRQWDNLLRLAASIREGHSSAVHTLARYGSAARGDALHRAGVSLGRLQRTVFLCDYFTNDTFRRELLRILNHGESVHVLQRAIHRGGIGVRRERHAEELVATSGSLTLLTNVVMAWVTQRMQTVLDDWHRKGRRLSADELRALKHTSPLHFEGINFRGEMHFPIDRHAGRLFQNHYLKLTN